jgi:carboxylesterase type B
MFFWAANRQKYSKTPAYTYYWTHSMPGPNEDRWGAFHCSEIPYFLNTLNRSPRPFTANDRQIEAKMSDYYVSFVTTGEPNGKGLAQWSPVDATKPVTMELGDHWQAIPVANPARFELLKKFFDGRKEWR